LGLSEVTACLRPNTFNLGVYLTGKKGRGIIYVNPLFLDAVEKELPEI